MDGAEIDLTNSSLSTTNPSSKTNSATSSLSATDDYEKDLQLAAELGRCLLERNQELQSYINVLQKQVDEEQNDIKLLHIKLESTREQLETKCKQAELLDAANLDLERELIQQRQENERSRQRIKELAESNEKMRKHCSEIEQEYDRLRSKKVQDLFNPKFLKNLSTKINDEQTKRRQRRHSDSSDFKYSKLDSTNNENSFDSTFSSVFKAHLTEFKNQFKIFKSDYSLLNEKLQQTEEEKRRLVSRLNEIERERRDELDSFQNELTNCRKLLEKSSKEILPANLYSPPEHDLSLYDEVLFERKFQPHSSSYRSTNYKELFARVYEKLKINKSLMNNSNDRLVK